MVSALKKRNKASRQDERITSTSASWEHRYSSGERNIFIAIQKTIEWNSKLQYLKPHTTAADAEGDLARCSAIGSERTCTSENCNTLRVNVHVTNGLCAWEGKTSDQQGAFVQPARRRPLSAVNTLEHAAAIRQ